MAWPALGYLAVALFGADAAKDLISDLAGWGPEFKQMKMQYEMAAKNVDLQRESVQQILEFLQRSSTELETKAQEKREFETAEARRTQMMGILGAKYLAEPTSEELLMSTRKTPQENPFPIQFSLKQPLSALFAD